MFTMPDQRSTSDQLEDVATQAEGQLCRIAAKFNCTRGQA
jgi:hypothetical protein